MPDNQKANLYPTVTIGLNQNPNRLYAVPILGAMIKVIILIPVLLILIGLSIASFFLVLINSFMVLFTGKYWDLAYKLVISNMRYSTKTSFFMAGLTDTYPGFDLQIHDNFVVDMANPQTPNRLFAIPFLGFIARVLLLIPFSIFTNVISTAASMGVFLFAWAFVLFTGKYPEALHELYRDSVRVSLASSAYLMGLSDKYPSFWISMNHKNVKIALIVVAALLTLFQWMNAFTQKDKSADPYMNQYQNQTLPSEQLPTEEFPALDQSLDTNYQ